MAGTFHPRRDVRRTQGQAASRYHVGTYRWRPSLSHRPIMSNPPEKQIARVAPISACTNNCETPADEIENLAGMGVEALIPSWKARFRIVAPPIRSTDTLRRLFAWRIQAQAFGDLDPETA